MFYANDTKPSSFGSLAENFEYFKTFSDWVGDLFGGLDYFTGEDFQKLINGGWVK